MILPSRPHSLFHHYARADTPAVNILCFMTQSGWQSGFGDNDLLGWTTTAAYFIVALLCTAAFRDEARSYRVIKKLQRPTFWLVLTALLVLLGFNKQLDLQTWVQSSGDHFVQNEGLEPHRTGLKILSLLMLTLCGAGVGLGMLLYIGRQWRLYLLALVGVMYLGVFIVLRAADSLPFIDSINHDYYESIHLLFELGGILMIGISAARAVYRETRRFKSRPLAPSKPSTSPQPAV
jgi:hypothetical protein